MIHIRRQRRNIHIDQIVLLHAVASKNQGYVFIP